MYNPQDTAERINRLAKLKGIQQKNLLDECGLNKNVISTMLSRGSMPKADNLARIADYLDCSVDYLLGRTDCPEVARNPAPATASTIKIAAKGRGAHVIEMEPEQIKALKEALAQLPEE